MSRIWSDATPHFTRPGKPWLDFHIGEYFHSPCYILFMTTKNQFTAVYKKTKNWFVAWIEEIPGVNTQGKTLKEARENLQEALLLILESNREASRLSH